MDRYIFLDPGKLLHHILIYMKTPGCIQDHHIVSVGFGVLHTCFGDIHRIMAGSHGEHRNLLFVAVDLQLLDGRWTIYIACHQQWASPLRLQLAGKLGRGGSLSGALKTAHHNYRHFTARKKFNLGCGLTHHPDHLFIYIFYHGLPRSQAVQYIFPCGLLLYRFDKLLHYLEVYICLQKSHLNFLQSRFHIRFRQAALAPQSLKHIL